MKMKQKLWLFFLGVSCLGFQSQEKSMRISLDEAIAFANDLAVEAQSQLEILPDSPAKEVLLKLPVMSIDRAC